MSINSLANSAAARRPDVGQPDAVPTDAAEIAAAAAVSPDKAPATQQKANTVSTTFNVLFGYIPTEVVTLYVAVSAGLQPANQAEAAARQALWIAFGCFLAATPLAVWVVYATKLKGAKKPLPAAYSTWPVWEMIAAMLAFSAWAFALPNSPFREAPWYSPALASIVVLLAATALGAVAPLFQRPLGTG